MTEQRNTVVYATDEQFWTHTFVSLYSLLVNNRDLSFDVQVLTEKPIRRLERDAEFLRGVHPDVDVSWLKVSESLFADAPLGYITKESYYRLAIGSLLPASVDQVLYIDGDTTVRGSLRDLFAADMSDHVLAGIWQPDEPGKMPHARRLGLPDEARYFNAGVLLINLDLWRERGIEEQCFNYVYDNLTDPLRLQYHDQDTLNVILHGRWKPLNASFNFSGWTVPLNDFERGHWRAADGSMHEPVIIHYAGPVKPWHGGSPGVYDADYWHYRMQTPHADQLALLRARSVGVVRRFAARCRSRLRRIPWLLRIYRSLRSPATGNQAPDQPGVT